MHPVYMASDLIKELHGLIAAHGDLPVDMFVGSGKGLVPVAGCSLFQGRDDEPTGISICDEHTLEGVE